MALPRTRQSFLFEEPMMGDFNLGMGADAFMNLGMPNLAAIQGEGLMGLPGANTTVANPLVAENLMNQAVAKTTEPTLTAADLPPTKVLTDAATTAPAGLTLDQVYQQVLGRAPDIGGQQYWSGQFGETVDPTELARFTEVAAPELKAKSAYEKYVTGYDPTQEAIDLLRQEYAKTGAKDEDVLKGFLNPTDAKAAADRMFLMQADPDYVAFQKALQPVVDKSAFPKFEGTPYDPAAYDKLVAQLTNQSKVLSEQLKIPYESTFGGTPETIADMAKRLASMGISDIRDFGQRYNTMVEKVYETIPGEDGSSMTFDTGKYRMVTGIEGTDSEGSPIYTYRELTPSEEKRLKFKDGAAYLDVKPGDLPNTPLADTIYYNKKTGEILDTKKIGGKGENVWGSSGSGKGYTNYQVVYTKDGMPVFVPEKKMSGLEEFIAKDLSGLLTVASFIPGAQPFVLAAQAAAAAHMGVPPEKILQNLAMSFISSNLGKLADTYLPNMGFDLPTTEFGKTVYDAAKSGIATLVKGGDIQDAFKSAGISIAGKGIAELLPKSEDFDYTKILSALAPAVADGRISNSDVFRVINVLAKDANKDDGKDAKKTTTTKGPG